MEKYAPHQPQHRMAQMTKIDAGFRMRNISVSTALLLSEEKPTEIVTSFRPLPLTISQDSSWYDFTISAYNGNQWTKYCSGEVKAESGILSDETISPSFARIVAQQRWFDGVRSEGLDLGHGFFNVDEITASTTTYEAQGTVSANKYPDSKYHIHPAVLDSAVQLLSVASSNGLTRKHKNFLLVFCEELFISRTSEDFVMNVAITEMGNGSTSSRVGKDTGAVDGVIVLEFAGFKMAPASISDESERAVDPHAASRLAWAADLDCSDVKGFFKGRAHPERYAPALEKLGKLIVLHLQTHLANVSPQKSHLKKYAQWIKTQADSYDGASYAEKTLSHDIQQLCATLANTPAAPVAAALSAVSSGLGALLSGGATSRASLVPVETVEGFYDFITAFDGSAFFGALGHLKPNLRVLEIGNWTSSPSVAILESLTLEDGRNLWSQYTFATKSLVPAKERVTGYVNLDYATLDLAEDPAEQGFEGKQYDIIIANNAIHATPHLVKALQYTRKLLVPDGRLFLHELTPLSKWVNIVLGTAPLWWNEVEDGRFDEPYVSAIRWQECLKAAGYRDVDAVVLDSDASSQLNCVIITRPEGLPPITTSTPIFLLVENKTKTYNLEKALGAQGYEIIKITLKDATPSGAEIVSILDLDSPFFENIVDDLYYDFQNFLTSLEDSSILWVTRSCHILVQDPRYAQVIGLARVIRSEFSIDFATCELDNVDTAFPLVGRVLEKFRNRVKDDFLSPDYEYAIDAAAIHIGRYFPFVMTNGFIQEEKGQRMKIVIGTPGRVNTLHWAYKPEPPPLKGHEIEIKMHAVGVNYKDILVSMSLIDRIGRYHGLEGAGVVRRVGPLVVDFQPGDRVAAMEHNMLSTLLISDDSLCAKIPDSLSFVDAATMFTVYATVQQSLITIGQLEKVQTVLIHSACGGVGLAAVQIATMLEAEIYATVSSEEKAQDLVQNCNISKNKIFHSQDNSFVKDVYRETGGKGVDLILNSHSGELLHESWMCVAPFGKMIEIGKRQLLGYGKLEIRPFLANRSYCCVDIDPLSGNFKE